MKHFRPMLEKQPRNYSFVVHMFKTLYSFFFQMWTLKQISCHLSPSIRQVMLKCSPQWEMTELCAELCTPNANRCISHQPFSTYTGDQQHFLNPKANWYLLTWKLSFPLGRFKSCYCKCSKYAAAAKAASTEQINASQGIFWAYCKMRSTEDLKHFHDRIVKLAAPHLWPQQATSPKLPATQPPPGAQVSSEGA